MGTGPQPFLGHLHPSEACTAVALCTRQLHTSPCAHALTRDTLMLPVLLLSCQTASDGSEPSKHCALRGVFHLQQQAVHRHGLLLRR